MRTRRIAILLLAALLPLAAGCGAEPAIPATDLRLTVTAPGGEVAPGRAFPLTVVRTWRKDLLPAAWDDRALAPLVLRLEEATLRDDATRFEETRRYRAYAMSREDLAIRPATLSARPKAGGALRVVAADGLRIRVKPEVEAEDPGAPELPGLPDPRPFPWLALVVGGGAALLLLLLVRARRRVPAVPEGALPATPAPSAEAMALERLARLRGAAGDPGRDVTAAADVVRTWLKLRHGIPALEQTTREVLADPALASALGEEARKTLAGLLASADRVKFAAHLPTVAERETRLDEAKAVVGGGAAP